MSKRLVQSAKKPYKSHSITGKIYKLPYSGICAVSKIAEVLGIKLYKEV